MLFQQVSEYSIRARPERRDVVPSFDIEVHAVPPVPREVLSSDVVDIFVGLRYTKPPFGARALRVRVVKRIDQTTENGILRT